VKDCEGGRPAAKVGGSISTRWPYTCCCCCCFCCCSRSSLGDCW